MSGRVYQGRGRGRALAQRGGRTSRGSGRISGKSHNKNSSPYSTQKEYKFAPHNLGKGQLATYAMVKEAIIQHIQKTFIDGNDVARCTKRGEIIDIDSEAPVRGISTRADQVQAALEQKGLDILFQEELRRFLDRKDNLRKGLTKAYALIFSNYCTKGMQNRIEEHPEFDEIEDDPMKLLEAIKTSMHDPVRAQYPLISMTEALSRFINVRQLENELLTDYLKRFKQLRDVCKSHMGTKMLDEFVEHTEAYKEAPTEEAKAEARQQAFEQWTAYFFLKEVILQSMGQSSKD